MQMETPLTPEDDRALSKIFHDNYRRIMRTAEKRLAHYGFPADRAEDVVQDVFLTAIHHRESLFRHPNQTGWLIVVVYRKVDEFVRKENFWMRCVLDISEAAPFCGDDSFSIGFRLRMELSDLIPPEDYLLLKRLYLDGYTYDELAAGMGIKKSALAMRVSRIKARFLAEYKKSENICEQPRPNRHNRVEEVLEDARQ